MRHAVILTGTGRYADPWHPFPATSAALATEAGFDCEVLTAVDGTLAGLRTAALPDLVIANLGPARQDTDAAVERAARDGLDRVLSEAPLLAVHMAVGAFPDAPAWERRLGARWIDGQSFHPEFGLFTVSRTDDAFPAVEASGAFPGADERYQSLRLSDDNRVLYTHRAEDGTEAPTVWVREAEGVRTAVDVLGHDPRSYESPEHRDVLGALMQWLVGVS